jgi:hypothetical protein
VDTPVDPLEALEHDHAALNERVLALGPLLAKIDGDDRAQAATDLGVHLVALRDDLFLHFAREEDGLFPYLVEIAPDLEPSVTELLTMHDEICGTVARLVHIAADELRLDVMLPLFDRFELAYVRHAQAERRILETAAARLAPAQRRDLAAVVAGV